MTAAPYVFRDPPAPCPPPVEDGEWMAGGCCDPAAAAAFGFSEAAVVNLALAAYMDAYLSAPPGTSREELRAALVGRFVDELDALGA